MIIFVICGKHPLKSSGGYATYASALCKSLKSMGFDVNLIVISKKSSIEESEIGKIYTVTSSYLPTESSTFITSTFFLWCRIIDKLLQSLIGKENNKCIIYGIGAWAYAGIGSRNRFKENVRLVNVFFTTAPHETYWLMKGGRIRDYGLASRIKYSLVHLDSLLVLQRYENLTLKKSDAIIVHNEFPKQMLLKQYSVDPKKISKIPYYIEIYRKNSIYKKYDRRINSNVKYYQNDQRKGNFTCVSICRQEPRKGINYFLHSIKILKKKGFPIHAIIVGAGDFLHKNIKLAKKLQINDVVEFTGFLPEISGILSQADIFVQPSLQESGGSVSVLEALQAGVPVITTNCDGLPEDIENEKTGILVSRMDEVALAEAIINLYNDKNLCQQLILNGKKTISEKFNKSSMIEGLKSVNQKLW